MIIKERAGLIQAKHGQQTLILYLRLAYVSNEHYTYGMNEIKWKEKGIKELKNVKCGKLESDKENSKEN